ncbi:hypothetical protein K8R04_01790 [Candidatus Uhrbacteria bacterium]|nr:hypothetical protein [Candidatus Uhrbacteria bacterium]
MKRKLATARSRGRVSRRDSAAAESLHGHGLHPVQAVVGTGLMGADEARELGFSFPNFGSVSPGQSTGRLLHIILRDADHACAHQIRIMPTDREADILFDNGGERRIPASVLPALSMRAQRIGGRLGWHVQAIPAGTGPALQLIRKRVASERLHPADWSGVLDGFRAEPDGLLIVISPDAYVSRHFLAKYPLVESMDEWRESDGDKPVLYDADRDDGRELALHAALSGRTTVALMARSANDWWRPASEAGIPVRVVRSRLTTLGPAWESFQV